MQLASGDLPEFPPVDGNIARVVTRLGGLEFERGEPRKKPEVRAAVATMTQGLTSFDALETVYALVDLGALLCRPANPCCTSCPLRRACATGKGRTTGN